MTLPRYYVDQCVNSNMFNLHGNISETKSRKDLEQRYFNE